LSSIDSNFYQRALERALRITGIKNAPNEIDTEKISVITDALQGGFSIYEKVNFRITGQLEQDSSTTVLIFDPVNFDLENLHNNRLFEHRMLWAEFSMDNLTDPPYNLNDLFELEVEMSELGVGPAIEGTVVQGIQLIKRYNGPIVGEGPYAWHFPSYDIVGVGGDDHVDLGQWLGWVTAGTTLKCKFQSLTRDFPSGVTFQVNWQGIRVPKGCHLPL